MDASGQVSAPEFLLERRLVSLENDLRFAPDLIANLQSEHTSLKLEISKLRAEKKTLQVEKQTLQVRNQNLQTENQNLRGEIEQLKAKQAEHLKSLSQSQRAAKRQAAPFSKNKPKDKPEKNGRKSGEEHGQHGHREAPDPSEIDDQHQAPLPGNCPHCGHDKFEDLDTLEQFQEELPRKPLRRKFTIHAGTCCHCHKRVHGRHPLQTSDATGACSSQLGPDAQAAIVYLNKHAGMSYGKISQTFGTLFGVDISRGGCAQVVLRAAKKLEPAVQEIRQEVRESKHITPDETGWRIGGHTVWLHAWFGDEGATCYTIDPRRKADAFQDLIGIHWSGNMTHDGCSSYDRFESAGHQQCVDHALRRAERLIERYPDDAEFPARVMEIFRQALDRRAPLSHLPADDRERRYWRTLYDWELSWEARDQLKIVDGNDEHRTFAKHLDNHVGEWFLFLTDPSVPATNHRAEQALKTPIINRKVFGGNHTDNRARAQEATSSVLQTCKNRAVSFVNFLSDALCGCIAPQGNRITLGKKNRSDDRLARDF